MEPSHAASFRGQRFHLDLGDDDGHDEDVSNTRPAPPPAHAFVGDVVEREPVAAATPPAPAVLAAAPSGFPQHKRRSRVSAFKQQQQQQQQGAATAILSPADYRSIDRENKQRLAAMSDDEIELERRDLFSNINFDAVLLGQLMRRPNLDDGRGDTDVDTAIVDADPAAAAANDVSEEEPRLERGDDVAAATRRTVRFDDDIEPPEPGRLQPLSRFSRAAVHFPTATPAPDLDPADPSFFATLHAKYFPTLPVDPSKLAWMAPVAAADGDDDASSPYSPAQSTLPPSALRFDFRGALLPPRVARSLPVSRGLHHHVDAPEAAGYTVPELSRLARSAFPAQRCVAFQTLGRLLYRLGRAEWGSDDLAAGLWRCLADGRVLDVLQAAATTDGGHQGCKAYAVEALWLWQKGGGHNPGAGGDDDI